MKKLTMLLMAMLMTAASCTNHKQPATDEDDGYNRADSIVSAIGDARDFPRLLTVVDSLENTGELSLLKTIFYRTITYNLMGQKNNSLRLYYQLAGIGVDELATQADLECYIYSYKDYVRLLCDMRRYDRALREANNADRKLKEVGYNTFTEHQDIAQIMGECLLYLEQEGEAAKSFQKSLKAIRKRLATYHDPLDLRESQKTLNAIAKGYIDKGHYNEAEPWIAEEDSLYAVADAHPQRDTVYVDEMKAEISYSKALLALKEGRTADAERAFSDYLSTNTAKELGSIINSNEYLILTHRYEEATRNYQQLDHFLMEGGYNEDLENFGRFMLPKFRANLLAGHRDSALFVANKVAEYYDSALIRQKMIDADLLSTIYDTEGKERQIAEQHAKLSQQRLITLAIVTLILVIFFHVIAIVRRRAFKKLDATNRQLVLANERAEESARMKTNFIQQISHEVRTPLNVLSGFAQVLATPDIRIGGDELQAISQSIVDNSERITHLIDKMLDLSQINSNAIIECHDKVNPENVARQAIDTSGISTAGHLDFQLKVSPESESLNIVTNHNSAVKALTLILDNAIKFTHPLAFRGRKSGNDKAHVTLSIDVVQDRVCFVLADTGIGVPPDQAENIFGEFVQLDNYAEGTGIGLAIARSLARHMGGDIVLDTTYTDGARFIMSLPA